MKTLRGIMREGFLFTVQRNTTVAAAVRTMAANNVGIVAVVDADRLCGVFSERDVVRTDDLRFGGLLGSSHRFFLER